MTRGQQDDGAEVERLRSMLAGDEAQRLATDLVRAGGRCPECGRPVAEVGAEQLDYAAGAAVVALPCGHSFAREADLGD